MTSPIAAAYRASFSVLGAALRERIALTPAIEAVAAAARALVASGEQSADAEHAAEFLRGYDA